MEARQLQEVGATRPRAHKRVAVAWLAGAIVLSTAGVAQAAGSGCGPAPGIAEPTADARAVYEAAQEHTRRGDYDEALAAFQRAYDLSPSYVILFNIGKAAELTGDSARAIVAYRCHLVHGASEIEASRQAEVTASIALLEKKVGLVAFEIDEPGAIVSIDGARVGSSPLDGPIPINPGRRLVRVQGSRVQSRAIDVAQGTRLVLEFDVRGDAPAPKLPRGEPFRFPGGALGAAWISAGLLGVSTAVTGTLAVIGAKDIEDEVYLGPGRVPPNGSELDDKIERTNAFATATDVLLTAFLITGSAAITFSIVNAVNAPTEEPAVEVGLAGGGGFVRIGLP